MMKRKIDQRAYVCSVDDTVTTSTSAATDVTVMLVIAKAVIINPKMGKY